MAGTMKYCPLTACRPKARRPTRPEGGVNHTARFEIVHPWLSSYEFFGDFTVSAPFDGIRVCSSLRFQNYSEGYAQARRFPMTRLGSTSKGGGLIKTAAGTEGKGARENLIGAALSDMSKMGQSLLNRHPHDVAHLAPHRRFVDLYHLFLRVLVVHGVLLVRLLSDNSIKPDDAASVLSANVRKKSTLSFPATSAVAFS